MAHPNLSMVRISSMIKAFLLCATMISLIPVRRFLLLLICTNLYSILDIAKMYTDNIVFVESRKGDRDNSIVHNIDKTKELLNWSTTMNIEEWISKIKQ
jgi:nucleoside-diphosphate-sugar epimerase